MSDAFMQPVNVHVATELTAGGDISIQDVQVFYIDQRQKTSDKFDVIPERIREALYSNSSYFIFPKSQTDDLRRLLDKKEHLAIISGMSGTGKTELAIQYLKSSDYLGGIIWSTYEEFIDNTDKLRQYCETTSKARILWIIDGVFDLQQCKKRVQIVQEQLKVELHVLITTQERLETETSAKVLNILSSENSIYIFKIFFDNFGYFHRSREIAENSGTAEKICDFLGNLPLGIHSAATFLKNHPQLSLANYFEELTRDGIRHDSMQNVISHFEIIWEKLDKSNFIIYLFSLLSFRKIQLKWLKAIADQLQQTEQSVDDVCRRLHHLYLIEYSHIDKSSFTIHPLLRAFFLIKLNESNQVNHIKKAGAIGLLRVADSLWGNNQNKDAEPLYKESLSLIQEWLTDDIQVVSAKLMRLVEFSQFWWNSVSHSGIQENRELAKTLVILANICKNELPKKTTKAEYFYLQALAIHQRLGDHNEILSILNNLASLYESQEKINEAESSYLQALALWQRLGEKAKVFSTLTNFAHLCERRKKYYEAELLYLLLLKANPQQAEAILIKLSELYQYNDFIQPFYLNALETDKLLNIDRKASSIIIDKSFSRSLNYLKTTLTITGKWFLKNRSLIWQNLETNRGIWNKVKCLAQNIKTSWEEAPQKTIYYLGSSTSIAIILIVFLTSSIFSSRSNTQKTSPREETSSPVSPRSDSFPLSSESSETEFPSLPVNKCGDRQEEIEGLPRVIIWRPVYISLEIIKELPLGSYCLEDQPRIVDNRVQIASFADRKRAEIFARTYKGCIGKPKAYPSKPEEISFDPTSGRFLSPSMDRLLINEAYLKNKKAIEFGNRARASDSQSATEEWQDAIGLYQEGIALMEAVSQNSGLSKYALSGIRNNQEFIKKAEEEIYRIHEANPDLLFENFLCDE